eukprot:6178765-Pleurochrysis_carterae.AAC.2
MRALLIADAALCRSLVSCRACALSPESEWMSCRASRIRYALPKHLKSFSSFLQETVRDRVHYGLRMLRFVYAVGNSHHRAHCHPLSIKSSVRSFPRCRFCTPAYF